MQPPSRTADLTANDRFKRGFGRWFWLGLILATAAHAALFLVVPEIAIADVSPEKRVMEGFEIPDRIEIPTPPEVVRPVAPRIGDIDVDDDLTIPPTDLESNPEGRVVRTLINESSGYAELDEAALRVANRMEFSPAWNRDQRVPVWVSVPITFEVGG